MNHAGRGQTGKIAENRKPIKTPAAGSNWITKVTRSGSDTDRLMSASNMQTSSSTVTIAMRATASQAMTKET